MNIKFATKLALLAAIIRASQSLYLAANFATNLGDLLFQTGWILPFLANVDWLHSGLSLFLATILFRPRAVGMGLGGLVAGALIQAGVAINSLLPILYIESYREALGDQKFIAYLGAILPLMVLVFALVYFVKPGWPVRTVAFLIGLASMTNLLLQIGIYPLNWIFLIKIVAVTFVAQWFWLLFLQGKAALT